MATYEICGSCSILSRDGKMSVRLVPAVGYVSADKELAVFYSQNSPPYESKVDKLSGNVSNKYIEKPLKKKDNNLIAILTFAAGSSKKIQLFLDNSLQVIGCLFPAP